MVSADSFWAYLIAISLLTMTPGVDTLLVMRNTARGGLRDGIVSSVGICSGLFFHATLSAVGISVILMQTAWVFAALKWAGALYLVWLGLTNLRQAMQRKRLAPAPLMEDAPARRKYRSLRSLREGVFSNLLNPKTALFYMAFLPQFVDPQGNAFIQSIGLAAVHFLLAMLWQTLMAFMIVYCGRWIARPGLKRAMSGLTGGVFVGLGVKLAVTQP